MEDKPAKRSVLGTALTMAGAVLGVLAVIALRIQLKASISPDNHNITLIRSLISLGAIIAFGLSAALIVGGAWIGRRRRLRDQQKREDKLAELRGGYMGSETLDFSTRPEGDPLRDCSAPQ